MRFLIKTPGVLLQVRSLQSGTLEFRLVSYLMKMIRSATVWLNQLET